MAALKLAGAEEWKQLFTDATTRRQVLFQCLLIGVMDGDDKIDPVVVLLCIFMEDERSETEAKSILDKVCLCIFIVFSIWRTLSKQFCACIAQD